VLLYDMPLHLAASPVTRLHRAIAVAMPRGRGPLRGSVQYREGARTGQIRERRENGQADGNASSGAMTLSREVIQGVG
jgi:hypothetical protein